MASRDEKLRLLREALDRAPLDPAAWKDVCDALANMVDATGSLMIPLDVNERGLALPHSQSLGECLFQYVEAGWFRKDFRSLGFARAINAGFVTDHDLISPEDMPKHPFYAELLLPHGLQWFVGVPFQVAGKVWSASVQASPERGPFSSSEIGLVVKMREALSMAAKQSAALGFSRIEAFQATFAAADRGVATLDWSGRLSGLNAKAEEILRSADLSTGNRLRSTNGPLDQRLADLVAGAVGYKFAAGSPIPAPVLIPSGNNEAIVVDAVPMPRDFQALVSGTAAIVTLHLVTMHVDGTRKSARHEFRLTAREAELVAHLVDGKTLTETAAALGISVGTARQYVKSVFAKTGTHRQAQLVALFTRRRD